MDADPLQTCFTPCPAMNASAAAKKEWMTFNAKVKARIILGLGYSAQTKMSAIIDDPEGTAKDLWENIGESYTKSSHQTIVNIEHI